MHENRAAADHSSIYLLLVFVIIRMIKDAGTISSLVIASAVTGLSSSKQANDAIFVVCTRTGGPAKRTVYLEQASAPVGRG